MFKKFARWILKKELAKLKQAAIPPVIYIDTDDSDPIPFWREIHEWSKNRTARKWAFREINSLLNQLVTVNEKNPHMFWGLQGALEQMNRFMQLPDLVSVKLEEVIEASKEAEKPEKKIEPDSLSESHS